MHLEKIEGKHGAGGVVRGVVDEERCEPLHGVEGGAHLFGLEVRVQGRQAAGRAG